MGGPCLPEAQALWGGAAKAEFQAGQSRTPSAMPSGLLEAKCHPREGQGLGDGDPEFPLRNERRVTGQKGFWGSQGDSRRLAQVETQTT